MANFAIHGLDEIIRDLEALGDTDGIAMKIVNEAAEIMDRTLKDTIKKSTQKYGTGQLANSIHHNKPIKNELGVFTVSTARGKDSKGVRNHDKLYYLEYGTSRQNPNPVVQKAVNAAQSKVFQKMQEVYDRETKL